MDGKERVNASYIYTRIMDTNTPRDKSADEASIELLWKKRFGLVPVPTKRFERYLRNKSHWIEREQTMYYDESPEFTIEILDDTDTYIRGFLSFVIRVCVGINVILNHFLICFLIQDQLFNLHLKDIHSLVCTHLITILILRTLVNPSVEICHIIRHAFILSCLYNSSFCESLSSLAG